MQATLTILFTDAVASTEALARLGDEQFGVVQRAHLDLLRAAVTRNGGREVKSLGDGLMVVFTGAADALSCTVSMQQAIEADARRGAEGLPLRVGVSLGDVTVDGDGDCAGTAVVEAARLCAAARGGQVLASEVLRAVAGSRGGHAFTPLGPVELKGLAEPVAVVELGWAPLAAGEALAPVPLPSRLAFQSSWVFVGRRQELERLDELWAQAVAGGARVALLSGEPGAGKTRLAREFAVRAHEQGALVLFGRVDEDMAVAYQPFAEALAHYLASVDEPTREQVLALRGGVLARLVPELADQLPEGQVESWAIFEGIVDWLSGEAARRPVVLVLDDLHWAAKPTLQALLHLVRSERLSRLLIAGTYRDTELARTHPLSAALADLRREEGVERLSLRGLDDDGVAAFVAAAGGGELDDDARGLAAQLTEQTQGNPFFVGQVLRHLVESGTVERVDGRWARVAGADEFVVPEGVREVVGRRVSRLSDEAGQLLTVAAVTGPEFDTAVVGEVAGQPLARALDGFDEAVGSRLVLETDSPGHLRFAHALVRQTLEDELTTLRRLHLHRDIGLAMERRFADSDSVVADLAHHFAEAAALGEGERAARYAERAADQALDRGAPDQAAELLVRALDLLPAEADPDGMLRDRLFAQLANCLYTLWALERIEDVSRAWLALARERGDYGMRVNATAWLVISWVYRKIPEPEDLALVAEALRIDPAQVDVGDRRRLSWRGNWCTTDATALRAVLLGSIAYPWAYNVRLEGLIPDLPADSPLALADEACGLAAASADPEIIDETQWCRLTTLAGHPEVDEYLREAERTIAAGYSFGAAGWTQLMIAHVRLGRLDELATLSAEMQEIGDRTGDRLVHGMAGAAATSEALLRGRIEDARIATDNVIASAPDVAILQLGWAQLTVARLLHAGRPDEARPIADRLAAAPGIDYGPFAAAIARAQGDLDPSREVLAAWHAGGHMLAQESELGARLWALAECAHALGDEDAAGRLYDQLLPYDGQLLNLAVGWVPASAGFTLGLLAETLGDRDRASRHYTEAIAFEERIRAEVLAVRTREALARISG